jgi:uncharacterized protein YegJ (DUF2314 family)
MIELVSAAGLLGALAAAGAGGFLVWRKKRRKKSRLVSFVALVREPVTFDPAVLARVAGKAWGADLGDGSSEGPDGFVAGVGVMTTISYGGRLFLINGFPRPYVEDVAKAAESIRDLRLRSLFAEHRAWFSCDALGVDAATPEAEVREWYRLLGRLFVELLDENCLAVFLPDSGLAYAINEETEAALRSADPVRELQETRTMPVVEVSDDDPLMRKAVATARERWPEFVAAFEAGGGENFSVKAPVGHAGRTEFIWIGVTAVEGDRVYGTLANDPADLGPLKLGSKVSVKVSDLNDWCYIDAGKGLVGGFTIEAVQKAAKRRG